MAKRKSIVNKIIFIIGFLLCSYPLVSNIVEGYLQRGVISTYEKDVKGRDKDYIANMKADVHFYNECLFNYEGLKDSTLSDENYNRLLNTSNNGVMGSLEIPKIKVDLPIYHGVEDSVLSVGVGHVEGSSLPLGGESTRSVLTGHRGSPNSKLFTRLDELEKGDLFYINVLDDVLAYEVNDIMVIKPEEVDKLKIQSGEDLVSLVTCTPYGINTHRLVVTGERVPYSKEVKRNIDSSSLSVREMLFSSIPFIFIGLAVFFKIKDRRECVLRIENKKN